MIVVVAEKRDVVPSEKRVMNVMIECNLNVCFVVQLSLFQVGRRFEVALEKLSFEEMDIAEDTNWNRRSFL